MNRGIARRAVFETRSDVRYFLACLARSVRRGEIEVHVYCILTTHFHVLVRSTGELSRAIGRVENSYVRWFNRRRKRDGPLFRGRFKSKRIDSDEYWHNVVRYIDQNAVGARLCADPGSYPFGSAFHYERCSGPPWLRRIEIEETARRHTSSELYDPSCYQRTFGASLSSSESELVEKRLVAVPHYEDDLEELLSVAPKGVLSWMRRKAELADGTRIGTPVVSARTLSGLIEQQRRSDPRWIVRPERNSMAGWLVLEAGLLRLLAGLRLRDIAGRIGSSEMTASRMVTRHGKLLKEDDEYARRAAELLARAMREDHGRGR